MLTRCPSQESDSQLTAIKIECTCLQEARFKELKIACATNGTEIVQVLVLKTLEGFQRTSKKKKRFQATLIATHIPGQNDTVENVAPTACAGVT